MNPIAQTVIAQLNKGVILPGQAVSIATALADEYTEESPDFDRAAFLRPVDEAAQAALAALAAAGT